jgi:hypothetical protein
MLQESQARIMLAAACNYIQECSRIGWDRYPNTSGGTGYAQATDSNDAFPGSSPAASNFPIHEEAFGWIDVRDGSIGPKTQEGRPCYDPALSPTMWWDPPPLRPAWPAVTGIVRCPMHVWQRPPYATKLTACYNPINSDPSRSSQPDYLYPFLRNPDPQPQVSNGWVSGSASVSNALYDDGAGGATRNDFVHGDPRPRGQTTGKSWFRILREGPATFLVTVGAGGTAGFRSYNEASQQGFAALFNNDPDFFRDLSDHELRLWFRMEWSAAVTDVTYHWNLHHTLSNQDNYLQWPQNASHSWSYGCRSSGFDRNMGGTFRWIERLLGEPTSW